MSSHRSLADQVRAILVKRAFVPGDPSMAGGAGGMPADPAAAAAGGMPADPAAAGGMPADPAAMAAAGGAPADPAAAGAMPTDPMGGVAVDPAAAAAGGAPATGMINMTADEFTKFLKQIMAVAQGGGAQQAQPDIGGKLDTLIAVLQGQGKAAPAAAPAAVPA